MGEWVMGVAIAGGAVGMALSGYMSIRTRLNVRPVPPKRTPNSYVVVDRHGSLFDSYATREEADQVVRDLARRGEQMLVCRGWSSKFQEAPNE